MFNNAAMKAHLHTPPWFPTLLDSFRSDHPALAYATIPVLYRAIQLRCNALAAVPARVTAGEADVEWPFSVPLAEFIWHTEAALLITGVAYWLRITRGSRLADVRWVNPLTITVEWDEERQTRVFTQSVGGRTFGPWTDEEMVMLREFDIRDDVLPTGTSPTSVAMGAAQVSRWVTEFAWRFFEGGAMPVLVLGVESPSGVLPPDERKRMEGFFKRAVEGIRNAWRVLVLGAAVKPTPITPPLDQMDMSAVMDLARRQVALAFGIPQTMLEDAANYATAAEHRASFWSETVRPRARLIEQAMNKWLLAGTGLEVRFAFEEMDIFQEDETARAQAFATYVNAGIRPSVAASMLGLELPEGVEYADLDGGDQSGRREGDDIVSTVGGELLPPAARAELRAWRRKALRRAKAGKAASVPFVAEHIPPTLAAAIIGALEECRTPDDVRAVFDSLLEEAAGA